MLVDKQFHESTETLVRTEGIKELAYLLLEQYYYGKHTDRDEFVEDAAKKSHLQYLAHKQPYEDEDHDADEDVQ